MRGLLLCLFALADLSQAIEPREGFVLNQRAVQADESGDVAAAERLYRSAIEVWRSLGPSYDAHRATTLVNLGETLLEQGRWNEARQIAEEALPLNRRSLGDTHLRTIGNLNLAGSIALLQGDTTRAESCFNEALPVERKLYPASLELAHTLNRIAVLHTQEHDLEGGLSAAEEALEIAIKTEGDDGMEAAMEYGTVATIHRLAGRPERAIPLFRKARAIYTRLGAGNTPAFASFLSEEAMALVGDDQFVAAEENLISARRLLSACPACQFQLAIVNSDLGYLRLRQGRYKEAERLLSGALEVEVRTAPGSSQQVAGTLAALAEVRQKQGRHAEAMGLQTQSASR